MAQLPVAVIESIATHHGVIDRASFVEHGVSLHQINRRIESGRLVRMHYGVYRSAEWPDSERARCIAACLAATDGAISHTTAARLWNLRRCTGDAVHLTIARCSRVRIAGVVLHRSAHWTPAEIVTLDDGIRVTSPARTVCDLASVLGEEDLASVIEQVLDTFDLRSHTIERTARTMLAPGWRGSSTLRRVLAQRAPGSSPQDSHLEVRLGRALVAAGLPAPVPQHPIPLDDGVVIHADLAYPGLRLAIEVDHRAWHSGDRASVDKRRDRRVRLAGYETVRVSDDDLTRRFGETVDHLVRIYRLRSGAVVGEVDATER